MEGPGAVFVDWFEKYYEVDYSVNESNGVVSHDVYKKYEETVKKNERMNIMFFSWQLRLYIDSTSFILGRNIRYRSKDGMIRYKLRVKTPLIPLNR